MKTTQIIKQLVLVSAVSIALSSCGGGGGGGGGGGESSSGSSNNNNSTDNTVQQETFSAPESLSSGMVFTMTSAETGKVSKFIITSPTGFVNESGTSASMEYARTGDKTCSISYKYDSSPMVTYERKFVFTSATGGDYYHGDKKMGTFTFAINSGNNSTPSDDTDAGDSSDSGSDDTDVVGYAPDNMPIGFVFERIMPGGTVTKFTIDSETRGVIQASGMSFTYEYSKKSANSATLSVVAANGTAYSHDLVFTSSDSGTCVLHNSEGDMDCQFRIVPASAADDTTDEGDDTDNSDDNDTPAADLAPDDLNAYEFHYTGSSEGTAFFFVNNQYNSNVIVRYASDSSWAEIGEYVYTKTGKTTATLSYSVSEMAGNWNSETQGALSLTFNEDGTVSVSGSTIDTSLPDGDRRTYTISQTYRVVQELE